MLGIKYAQLQLQIIYVDRNLVRYGSGDTVVFVILSKKKNPGSISSAFPYLDPLHIQASLMTIVLGPENAIFCP